MIIVMGFLASFLALIKPRSMERHLME